MRGQPTIFYILENKTLGTWWVGKMESTLDGCGMSLYRSITQDELNTKLEEKYYYTTPYLTLVTLNKRWNACYGVERWLSKFEYKINKEPEKYKELKDLLMAGWDDNEIETSTLSVLHVLEHNQPVDKIFKKLVKSREGLTRCLNKVQFKPKSDPEFLKALARKKVLMDMKKKQKLPKPSTLEKYAIKDDEIKECMGPKGIIYKIHCEVSGKSYIGKTIQSLKIRIQQHKDSKSYCRALSEAIQEHGWDNFKISTIWEGNAATLGEMERKLISEHGTMEPWGYNLREGGGRSERVSDTSRNLMVEKQREISKRRGGLLGVLIPNGHGKVTSWSLVVHRNGDPSRVGPFKTKEEATEVQKKFTEDPDGFELHGPKRVGNGKGSGIYYCKDRDKWQVLPRVDGKNVHLGRYETEEEAREALAKFREKDKTILE
jgi:group I intron endonuclease